MKFVIQYLGFDLLNREKHGFDAKNSKKNKFLEVKQCGIFSKRLGGTWNDTNEEKAKAFSDKRLYTVIGVWKGASNLLFMVFGQHKDLGKYLLKRVKAVANTSTRSTQSVSIENLIRKYNFKVIVSPDQDKKEIYNLIINYKPSLSKEISIKDLKEISDVRL